MSESQQSLDHAWVELYDIMQQNMAFEEKAQAALGLGKRYLNVDNAHLTRINQSTNHWEVIASTDPSDGTFSPGLMLDLETTYCQHVLDEGSSIALHDASEQGWPDTSAFETDALQCYHGTQLTVNNEVFGTVCFVSESPRSERFGDADTLFAELIARLLEHELEQSRQVEETTLRANSITVLSRVLRHNLRNEMTIVRGRVGMLAERLAAQTDDDVGIETLFDSIDRIIDLSDKARKLESVVATQFDREPIELDSLFDRATTNVSSEFPDAHITVDAPADITISAAPSLELALTELVENAAKHSGPNPEVLVTTTTTPDSVELSIVDNGHGLPGGEQAVLATGVETPLIHGSGLGLWMVYWIVTSHHGTIETTVTDDGTTVTVTLPQMPNDPAVNAQDVRALQRGRDRFEAAFGESFNAMLILNDEQRIIDANKYAATLFGNEVRELLGRHIDEFAGPSFDFAAAWEDLQATGQTAGEAPVRGIDGSEYVMEYRAVADIIPGQHLIVGQDITERKERNRALEESERRYRTLAENFPNGSVLVFDQDLRYQSAHGEAFDKLDLDTSSLVGKRIDEVFTGEQLERLREMYDATLRGNSQETEMWFEGRFFEVYTIPLRDDDEAVFAGLVMTQDVTEREQRVHDLHETTQRLDALIQTSPNAIVAVDTNGAIQVWNEAAEEIFGYASTDVIGESLSSLDIIDDADRDEVRDRMQRALDGEAFTDIEVQRQTRDGDTLDLNFSSVPLTDPEGTIAGILAVAEDVTKRKTRERELERAHQELQTILDTAECAIFLKDSDGTYRILNATAREVLGIDPDQEITGLTDYDLFSEEVAEQYRADDKQVLESGDSLEIEEEVPTNQGTCTFLTIKSPVFDEDGVPTGVCAVATDITARKKQKQLERENERLEDFAGLVSHDLRNPLHVANANLELARETRDSKELAAAAQAHERMEELIDDLLSLAKSYEETLEREPIELASLVKKCWEMVETQDATLVCDSSVVVEGDRNRLAQLFENLIRNAVEHGGAPVTITIRSQADGFEVSDDGTGIPEETRADVFEPGYSTLADGTGFGLKIVTSVVEAHGWDIDVTESAEGGAQFNITGVDIQRQ